MADDSTERGVMRDWQRQYRLSKARWHYQIIRLDHDDAETLRTLAAREGSTVPELIRTFVAWGLEEYSKKLETGSSG
jgi:Ribbon-helix-helix protein, copG family